MAYYPNSYDDLEEDDLDLDYIPHSYTPVYSFDSFKHDHPDYLHSLNARIQVLYGSYNCIYRKQFSKLRKNRELQEVANRIGFGMLMRHAMEAITVDLSLRNGIEVSGKNVSERLDALKGQNIPGYSKEKERILYDALKRTNDIAHPHVNSAGFSYADLYEFYHNSFSGLLQDQISQTTWKKGKKYMIAMSNRLEKFSVKDKITRILAMGCLTRLLTECATNLWCYNNKLVPTDADTAAHPIKMGKVLAELDSIARNSVDHGFGVSAMTPNVITALFDLKNKSNELMHVSHDKINVRCIKEQRKVMELLYDKVTVECSPDALEMKLYPHLATKKTMVTTLLCGFFGWFGVHHFYAGNVFRGLFYLLTCGGFLVGPLLSLANLWNGTFETRKWGNMPKSGWTRFVASIFIFLHGYILYLILFAK